ncbi:hypothetical protein MUK42_20621 [Musa troglodytarum]|uniref:Uncharacterized protein n=1 Tax=Musa troglodytarum TaxID=320322 RepID=A0A9E7ER90_9LILI|nr:hypothetical protein MUK42_20621 [Musa troglodytarum]
MGGKEWAAEFQQGEIWKRAGAMGRGSEIAGGSLEQKDLMHVQRMEIVMKTAFWGGTRVGVEFLPAL